MKFIIIIYTTNKLTVVEMEDIRGVRLRKFKLRKNCIRGKDAFSSHIRQLPETDPFRVSSSQDPHVNTVVVVSPSLHLRRRIRASIYTSSKDLRHNIFESTSTSQVKTTVQA